MEVILMPDTASCDVRQEVSITIKNLIGPVRKVFSVPAEEELEISWHITLAHNGEIRTLPLEAESTLYRDDRDNRWDETFDLAVYTMETNPSTCILLNLVRRDTKQHLAGGTFYLYDQRGGRHLFQQGGYKLRMWPGRKAEFPENSADCNTNSIPKYDDVADEFKRLDVIEKLLKEYEDGFIDPEAFQERVNPIKIAELQGREAERSQRIYVFVHMPQLAESIYYKKWRVPREIVEELEEERQNPWNPTSEEKFWKAYHKCCSDDPETLEPTARADDFLQELCARPFTHGWNPHERATFWKYRYWLRGEQHALPKFVQIMDWEDREEVEMVRDIILSWSRPSVWTCLELMAIDGPITTEDTDLLWAAAFSRSLYQASFEMMNHLLPCILGYFQKISLVQDFFPGDEGKVLANDTAPKKAAINLLGDLLIEKALEWPAFAQSLFWHLKIRSKEISSRQRAKGECHDNIYARLLGLFLQKLQNVGLKPDPAYAQGPVQTGIRDNLLDLQDLFKQEKIFSRIVEIFKQPELVKMTRAQRVDFLRERCGDPDNGVLSFTTVSLPYDAMTKVTGTLPDKLIVFKSNAMPVKVSFVGADIREHALIVKIDEDLRQDMFALEVLRLMDTLWRMDGFDFCVTAYKCLALTLTDGILEFIPSQPLSAIIAAYSGNLLAYLCSSANDASPTNISASTGIFEVVEKDGRSGLRAPRSRVPSLLTTLRNVPPEVMANYIGSCAGYCVFTYVMGVGDRHLDNLLLTHTGRIFHVDFSYLFGKDPKPFPPPMKLCKEMVEAMGGPEGEYFHQFKSLCMDAFLSLRKWSRILLAYIKLTADEVAVRFVNERLMIGKRDIDACIVLERLIDESMTALFPKVFETLHKWAQYWRH